MGVVGIGNCRKDSAASLLRIELLRMGGTSAASSRVGSSIKGRVMNWIDWTALDTVVEKVPFMLDKVKCEVNPDQCSLESEGTTLRKLVGAWLVCLLSAVIWVSGFVSSYYAFGSFPPTSWSTRKDTRSPGAKMPPAMTRIKDSCIDRSS